MKIKLTTIKDVLDFIDLIASSNSKATASQDRYVVSAHSIMGLFALDLLRPIDFHLESGDYSAFERFAA